MQRKLYIQNYGVIKRQAVFEEWGLKLWVSEEDAGAKTILPLLLLSRWEEARTDQEAIQRKKS